MEDNYGSTPLDLAETHLQDHVVSLIKKYKAQEPWGMWIRRKF